MLSFFQLRWLTPFFLLHPLIFVSVFNGSYFLTLYFPWTWVPFGVMLDSQPYVETSDSDCSPWGLVCTCSGGHHIGRTDQQIFGFTTQTSKILYVLYCVVFKICAFGVALSPSSFQISTKAATKHPNPLILLQVVSTCRISVWHFHSWHILNFNLKKNKKIMNCIPSVRHMKPNTHSIDMPPTASLSLHSLFV